VRADDVLEAPRKRGDAETAPPQYDLRLRLDRGLKSISH